MLIARLLGWQDMMAAVEASGAYEGHAEFTGEEGASKGKLVSNCRTLRTLGWRPKYGVLQTSLLQQYDSFERSWHIRQ